MQTSQRGLEFLEKEEGCVLYPYKDQAGKPTIGIGHLIKKGEVFETPFTRESALRLLAKDVKICEAVLEKFVKVTITQHRFDMLVSFIFNCGVGAFTKSTLLKALNLGRYDLVPKELSRWNKARGEDGKLTALPVLSGRRRREGEIWEKGYGE